MTEVPAAQEVGGRAARRVAAWGKVRAGKGPDDGIYLGWTWVAWVESALPVTATVEHKKAPPVRHRRGKLMTVIKPLAARR